MAFYSKVLKVLKNTLFHFLALITACCCHTSNHFNLMILADLMLNGSCATVETALSTCIWRTYLKTRVINFCPSN